MADKILSFRIDVQGVSQEVKQLSKLELELSELNQERRKYLKTLKEEKTLTKEEVKGFQRVTNEIIKNKQQRLELNKRLRDSNKEIRVQKGSINELRINTARLRKEMQGLNLTTVKGKARFKALNAEYQKSNTRLRDFDRQMSGSKTLVGEYGRGIKGAFTSLAIGVGVGVAAFRTLQRAIQATTRDLAEFEKGQANVQTLLDEFNNTLSGDTLDLIKQYGLEIADVNKALFDAVSAGVPAAKAIEFMAEVSKLAIGGVTDLTIAVDGVTSVLNGYGLSADEAGRVSAAFFSSQKFGKTTVAELSQEIGKSIPIAKLVDFSYQELLATFAELTKQGISTTETGTAIKNILVAVVKPSENVKRKFDELGIAYGQTNVKQAGFLNVLRDITEAVEAGDAELTDLIPNIRALTGAGALGTRQLDELDEILKVVNEDYGEGSSLARAFALQQETLAKSLDRIKAGFTAARISLGAFFAPLIKGFADLINPVETSTEALIKERAELNILVKSVLNVNNTEESRLRLIEDLNIIYPTFLAGLDKEKVTNEEIKKVLEDVNKEYENKLKLLIKEELLKRRVSEIADLLENELKIIRDLTIAESQLERTKSKVAGTTSLAYTYQQSYNSSIQTAQLRVDKLKGKLEGTRDAQESLNKQIQDTIDLLDDVPDVPDIPDDKDFIISTFIEDPILGFDWDLSDDLKKREEQIKEHWKRVAEDARIFNIIIDNQTAESLEAFKARFVEERKILEDFANDTINIRESLFGKVTDISNRMRDVQLNAIDEGVLGEEKAAERRKEISKKFANIEMGIEIAKVLAAAAAGMAKAQAAAAPFIANPLTAAIGIALLANAKAGIIKSSFIQIGLIAAQRGIIAAFAGGGKVQPGNELPYSTSAGDNTPALLTPGEVVLNKPQQIALGGDQTFKSIGVPGFAAGGRAPGIATPQPGVDAFDITLLARAFNDIRVILNVNELNAANSDLDIINEINPL